MFDGERPYHHRFSGRVIKLALDLYDQGAMGCRKIARVLGVISEHIQFPAIPHHTTVRQWVIRSGCYELQAPLEKANDWIALGDLTINIGKIKCLAILGVRMSKMEQRENLTLTHEDVQILGLHPVEKSNGPFACRAFEQARERVGGSLAGIVIDQGSDITKGAKLFQEKHPGTQILHDIPHKLSLVMERALKNDLEWEKYTQKLAKTRKLIYQTELAAIMPVNQRAKARFMDVAELVNWGERILEGKARGFLEHIPESRYEKYLGWVSAFSQPLKEWKFMIETVDIIKGITREHGLSDEVYTYLTDFFEAAEIEDNRLDQFVTEALEAISVEVSKLEVGQVMICTTEVLESIFGKYKEINKGSQEITGNVLGISAFVGSEQTEEEIKKAMEGCSVVEGLNWVKKAIGKSLASVRRQFFESFNKTKIDSSPEVVFTC